ncbi:hypothetical protein C84B14_10017 [Salinisphaera sp. C84B14]|uniref:META domain-containing protein n=1 Tax=Salinisphaera sp. C84B14 TaxID=1304155 RepID=UPI00333F9D67
MRAIRFSVLALLIVVALVGCAGTPTFMQLADTKWQLTQLDGQPVDTESMRRTPYLLLHADQRLEGFTGCNRVNGRYSGSDDSLRFDSLASTRRYCNQGMDIEEAFTHALERTQHAEIDGDSLALIDAQGHIVARLARDGAGR